MTMPNNDSMAGRIQVKLISWHVKGLNGPIKRAISISNTLSFIGQISFS